MWYLLTGKPKYPNNSNFTVDQFSLIIIIFKKDTKYTSKNKRAPVFIKAKVKSNGSLSIVFSYIN